MMRRNALLQRKSVRNLSFSTSTTINFRVSWKDIIFVPFNIYIMYGFMMLIYFSLLVLVYQMAYISRVVPGLETYSSIVNTLYWLHTILLILHRVMKEHRSKQSHEPVELWLLAVDLISIIPIAQIVSLYSHFTWIKRPPSIMMMRIAYGIQLIRVIRVYYTYRTLRFQPGFDQRFILIASHYFALILFAMCIGALYFYISCFKCSTPDWTTPFIDFDFNSNSKFLWMIICHTISMTMLMHNAIVSIFFLSKQEILLAIFTVLLGFALQYLYLYGTLIAEDIQLLELKNSFQCRLEAAEKYMTVLQVPKKMRNDIQEYYRAIWNLRKGFIQTPDIIKLLPGNTKVDLNTDIFWEFFMHSPLLNSTGESFKRMLSMHMKECIYIAGQNVVTKGETAHKMLYLVSGVVQMMSDDNANAPILSFSSGTFIGELPCIMPFISSATMRCATDCEFHSLSYKNLWQSMRKYPEVSSYLIETMRKRIVYGRFKQRQVDASGLEVSHIVWIKSQWRYIMKPNQKRTKRTSSAAASNSVYSSKYLSMLVLSSFDETKVHSICIRGSCPFVMAQNNSFLRTMQIVFLITDVLQLFASAYHIVFLCEINNNLLCFLILLDVIYFLDIYMQSITAIMEGNVLITQPSRIILVRGKKLTFLIDLIATIPYDYVACIFSADHYVAALLRIPRWLKLYKVILYFTQKENSISSKIVLLRVVRYLVGDVILITLLVCFTYLINCRNKICTNYGWVDYYRNQRKEGVSDLLITLEYVFSIYSSAKITYISGRNIIDLINYHIIMVIGFYSTCINMAQLVAVTALKNQVHNSLQRNIEKVASFIAHKKELISQKSTILEYAEMYHSEHRLSDLYLMDNASFSYIKKKIRFQYVQNILKRTNLFQHVDPNFLRIIANACESFIVPADHVLVREDQKVFNLYVVVQGFCDFKSFIAGDNERTIKGLLRPNDIFPLISFAHQMRSLVRVTTSTSVHILVLPVARFYVTLKAFPEEKEHFENAVKFHYAKHERNLNYFGALEAEALQSRKETVPMFRYKILQTSTMPSRNTGRGQNWRRFLQYIFVTTYNPESSRYFIYETFRCTVLGLQLFFNLPLMIPTCYKCVLKECYAIVITFKVLAVVDMFVRAHVQYYNNIGIRVTNPSYTWKHYRETGFFLDLFSNFPIHMLKIHALFGEKYKTRALFLMLLVARPLLCVRIIMLLRHLGNVSKYRHRFVFLYVAYIFIAVLLTVECSALRLTLSCIFFGDRYICSPDSWIEAIKDRQFWDDDSLLFLSVYSISIIELSVNFWHSTKIDIIVTIVISVFIICMRKARLIYFTGTTVFEDNYIMSFQDGVKNYKKFISDKVIGSKDVDELLQHYTYRQKNLQWYSTKNLFQSYYPGLKSRISFILYASTLRNATIFQDADQSFISYLSIYVQEKYFKKDADIIRCNDVQSKVFIVYKGYVEIKIAGSHICYLHRGGIFGCFNEMGMTRQTITVKSKVHVTLLMLDVKNFFWALHTQPNLYARVQHNHMMEREFVQEVPQSQASIMVAMHSKTDLKGRREVCLNETNVFFRAFLYLTSMHAAPISSIIIMFYVVINRAYSRGNYSFVTYMIYFIIDFGFIGVMVINMVIARIDMESGILIINRNDLVKRYVKSFPFYLDIVTLLPVSLVNIWIIHDNRNLGVYMANKIFRIFYMVHYYVVCVKRRNVPRHLQWTFVVYIFAFCFQLIACIWWAQTNWSVTNYELFVYQVYLQVASLITMTGIFWDPNLDLIQAISTLVIVLVCIVLITWLTCVFGRMLWSSNSYMLSFTRRIEIFCKYCNHTSVSKILLVKCRSYLVYLYKTQTGVQLPVLLCKAPPYIKQDHMMALYGKHLEKHSLFSTTHVDFIRQIVMYMEPYLYMPGDTVAKKGDKNDTMYFIESGEVMAIDSLYNELYKTSDSFGEGPGLVNIGHKQTYTALKISVILNLNRKKWEYLLDWFPATKEVILSAANANDIP